MATSTVTITDVKRMPSLQPQRFGKVDIYVQYEDAAKKRYTVTVPAEAATDDAIRAAIKSDVEGRTSWVGKTLQL